MGINISIVAGQNESASSVNATGTEQHVITDVERTTFSLSDQQLKDAVNAYFGKSPNSAHLRSPTSGPDPYKSYSWLQVHTVVVVDSWEILGITSEPVIVKTQEFVNNTSKTQPTFDVSISESDSRRSGDAWSVNRGADLARSGRQASKKYSDPLFLDSRLLSPFGNPPPSSLPCLGVCFP